VDLYRPSRFIWRDGLAYAFASFYVLTIPITGTFFSKRTWLLGKRYGFITPGDMYAYYLQQRGHPFSGRDHGRICTPCSIQPCS
jgi:Na+/proline symporter